MAKKNLESGEGKSPAVMNNIKKFEGEDFMFQPTRDELSILIKDSCRFSSDKGCAAESKKMVSRNKHLTE